MNGRIINKTNEILCVYGGDPVGGFDNSCFPLKPGEATSSNFDCDGFFVPNDRHVGQVSFPAQKGPAAVKIKDYQTLTVTQDGNFYLLDSHNWGIYRAGELNWAIYNTDYAYTVRWASQYGSNRPIERYLNHELPVGERNGEFGTEIPI
ncbi:MULTISPECIES: hypothetical protein [unclassified Paenibacillus]|uniref:hypothetical protein n=1 Tax=unclassified Paenibacillus TaxID=185978 RepID=UPI0008BA07F1|nr:MULTISPECIES: hypothetical protein [unclassified Paenibacillus]QLG39949.1 hypothetical protein HW560_18795 [Paenibacillus sp. E222]SEN91457.1 hypothetical protein SAMN05518670_3049 [Paenibacillus sp. OK076]